MSETIKVTFVSARKDEKGKFIGGKKGDQTGNELGKNNYYSYKSKGYWDYCIRIVDKKKKEKFYKMMEFLCLESNQVGYSQDINNKDVNSNRSGLHHQLVLKNGNYKAIGKCNVDCSSLIATCLRWACDFKEINYNCTTRNLMKVLDKYYSNDFYIFDDNYKNGDHTRISTYLRKGDILLKEGYHVVMVYDGKKDGF